MTPEQSMRNYLVECTLHAAVLLLAQVGCASNVVCLD